MNKFTEEKICELIKDEDDFLYLIYKFHREIFRLSLCSGKLFPRIISIPKGEKISPDIDLLCIQDYGKKTRGWEIKLIRPTDPFKYFYQGIGESLCYPFYGIEEVHLVLGYFDLIKKQEGQQIKEKLKEKCNFFATHNLLPKWLEIEFINSSIVPDFVKGYEILLKAESQFSLTGNENTKYRKDCLIRSHFEWAKKWLRNKEKQFQHIINEREN